MVLTADELQAVFNSNRNGAYAIFSAERANTSAGFNNPTPVAETVSATAIPVWLTGDGCTLFYRDVNVDGGAGGEDIWQVTRLP
jgi:hypothetical protein